MVLQGNLPYTVTILDRFRCIYTVLALNDMVCINNYCTVHISGTDTCAVTAPQHTVQEEPCSCQADFLAIYRYVRIHSTTMLCSLWLALCIFFAVSSVTTAKDCRATRNVLLSTESLQRNALLGGHVWNHVWGLTKQLTMDIYEASASSWQNYVCIKWRFHQSLDFFC